MYFHATHFLRLNLVSQTCRHRTRVTLDRRSATRRSDSATSIQVHRPHRPLSSVQCRLVACLRVKQILVAKHCVASCVYNVMHVHVHVHVHEMYLTCWIFCSITRHCHAASSQCEHGSAWSCWHVGAAATVVAPDASSTSHASGVQPHAPPAGGGSTPGHGTAAVLSGSSGKSR